MLNEFSPGLAEDGALQTVTEVVVHQQMEPGVHFPEGVVATHNWTLVGFLHRQSLVPTFANKTNTDHFKLGCLFLWRHLL